MDREDAFWIGNCIGAVVLFVAICIMAPIKQKERQAYEAQQKAKAAAAAQMTKPAALTGKTAAAPQVTKPAALTGKPTITSKTAAAPQVTKPASLMGKPAITSKTAPPQKGAQAKTTKEKTDETAGVSTPSP